MTLAEATQLLELPANATAEQIEARFQELRARLEDKIAKAPTPGLKAKYRESLDEITQALETLTLAADSSALPVLKKQEAISNKLTATDGKPSATGAQPSDLDPKTSHPRPTARRKTGGSREFIIVAVVAVLVLAGGGWYVIKTRAENAEKARVAAEAKAAAEQKAAAEKAGQERLAEEKRKADEAEKARLAAAQKAEQDQLEKQAADVRVKLAEAKLSWEQITREERDAATALSDLKSEERSARDAAPGRRAELAARLEARTKYNRWLEDFIASHPARRAQVRAGELLNARQIENAATETENLGSLITSAQREIAAHRDLIDAKIYGTLAISVSPADVTWELTDAFGRSFRGTSSGKLDQVAAGPAKFVAHLKGFPDQSPSLSISGGGQAQVVATFDFGSVKITSNVPEAEVFAGEKSLGHPPLSWPRMPLGNLTLVVRAPAYHEATLSGEVRSQQQLDLHAQLMPIGDEELVILFIKKYGRTNWIKANGSDGTNWQIYVDERQLYFWGRPGTQKIRSGYYPKPLHVLSRNPVRIGPGDTGDPWFEVEGEKLILCSSSGERSALIRNPAYP